MKTNNKPRILLLDYETSPAKGYFFGTKWETNIVKMIEYEQILSVSWNWYNESKINVIGQDDFKSYKGGTLNDKELIKFFAPILSSADFIVAHNGDAFDIKVFNTRLLFHRMNPVPTEKTFDTKKLAKNKFHFPSNSLNDIAHFLGIEGKFSHHGIEMWMGCEAGNAFDWMTMKKYDKKDTAIMKEIFSIMMPYVKLPAVFNRTTGQICPNPICGSSNLQKRGTDICAAGKKQRYQCQDCGKWSLSLKVLKE